MSVESAGLPNDDSAIEAQVETAAVVEDTEDELRGVDPVVRRRVQDWAKRLIDLSRRNRLLYYRPTKRTTLRLVAPDAIEIAETLLAEGSWRFYEPPEVDDAGSAESVSEALSLKPARARELVTHHADRSELVRSLEVISRRASAEFQDRGTHVLQMGWGMVRWQDDRSNEPVRSPLLLIPTVLSRVSIKEPWTLRPADDDPFLNPALRVKLQSDFGLQLPEVTDFADMRLADLADLVAEALPSGWEVESEAVLGIFGFAKEAMYRDLVDHIALVAADAQVQTLAHGKPMGEMREVLGISVPSGSELDEVQDPASAYSVLDADSSQRESIEAAIRGLSFVMHGPPGTGKSQTIANIIAEFIGRGRSVLFVSEKIAALEVVANRLAEAGLKDMVLELHSHKASRKEVAVELARVLDEDVVPHAQMSTAALDLLRSSRKHLNDYVAALHDRHEPIGRSVRAVLSELAAMDRVRGLPSPDVDASKATVEDLLQVEAVIGRLSASWAPEDPTATFTWHQSALERYTAADRVRIAETLATAKAAVSRVSHFEGEILPVLDLERPTSEQQRDSIAHVGVLLAGHPDVPRSWLTDPDLSEHTRQTKRWTAHALERQNMLELLQREYGGNWTHLDPRQAGSLASVADDLAGSLGVDDIDAVDGIHRLTALRQAAEGLNMTTSEASGVYRQAAERLGLRPRLTRLADINRVAEACELSQTGHRPPPAWLSRPRREEARSFIEERRALYIGYQQALEHLTAEYDLTGFESVDLVPLIARLEAHHGKWWSLLRPSHRADRRLLRRLHRDHEYPAQPIEDLRAIADLRNHRNSIEKIANDERRILGALAAGVATDLLEAEMVLAVAERLAEIDDLVADWDILAAATTFGTKYSTETERLGGRLKVMSAEVDEAATALASGSQERLDAWQAASPDDVVKATVAITDAARSLQALVGGLDNWRNAPIQAVRTAIEDLQRRGAVASEDDRLQVETSELRRLFGDRFSEWGTDWESIKAHLDWAFQLRVAYEGKPVPDLLVDAIQEGADAQLPFGDYEKARTTLRGAAEAVASLFEGHRSSQVPGALLAEAAQASGQIEKLEATTEEISVWIQHRSAVNGAQEAGWSDFVARASKVATAEELVPAARRAWLESWVDSAISQNETLRPFVRAEHERLSRTFRELDQAAISTARERLIARYAEGKPHGFAVQGGEEAVVRREAAKKKRHIPVRKLISQIPRLLPRIKPGLMMSPLSVSHFLPAEARFDVVIFDEASQVPPEDAINCVYRGAQLIVAGDEHQLPPTDFFNVAAESEEDQDAETQVDDFESVLDVCRASGFAVKALKWHYRSRHDELIAFSNHHIYGNSLVTFPAPVERLPEMGVHLSHVPNGVFDRGRSSKNTVEATRVVDHVVRLVREERRDSIGVVAFSVAQQEAILDELERRKRLEPDLESLIDGDRLSGLFVKNLETVQGDERDIIIFSVGYGRDASGRFLMNFGPLNRHGGRRRLNVAVTRARERVIVVSSVRAIDFGSADASGTVKSEGPRLLQAYLDYAERGPEALAGHLAESGGDFDSEFEREVAGVVRGMGYEVVPQVGTSGYRIDIGVRSSSAPGRFVVGIECDGAMYHSAKTARDRDRLRQSVLEGLGWRIHRVWSQDWFRHRSNEVERLRGAIEGAERELVAKLARPRSSPSADTPPSTENPPDRLIRDRVTRAPAEGSEASDAVPWARPYSVAQVAKYPRWADFNDWSMRGEHARRIGALVTAEGPLHRDYIATRLSRAFGLARTGARMQEAVRGAIEKAHVDGTVDVRGPFVWPKAAAPLKVRLPVTGSPDTQRGIEEVPPEEVDIAVLRTVEAALSIDRDQLVTQVARILGYERTGGRIGELLRRRIEANLQNGNLAIEGSSVVLRIELPRLDPPRPPAVSAPTSSDLYHRGERLRHPRYGEGVVREFDGKHVTVAFGDVVKEFAADQAPFERLSGSSGR